MRKLPVAYHRGWRMKNIVTSNLAQKVNRLPRRPYRVLRFLVWDYAFPNQLGPRTVDQEVTLQQIHALHCSNSLLLRWVLAELVPMPLPSLLPFRVHYRVHIADPQCERTASVLVRVELQELAQALDVPEEDEKPVVSLVNALEAPSPSHWMRCRYVAVMLMFVLIHTIDTNIHSVLLKLWILGYRLSISSMSSTY